MKINKKQIIIASLIITVLAVSFWFGDNTNKSNTFVANDHKTQEKSKKKEKVEKEDNSFVEEESKPKDSTETPSEDSNSSTKEESTSTQSKTSQTKTQKTESVKKDKYQTDPTPSDKPKPVEPEESKKEDKVYTADLSVSVHTLLNNMDMLDKNKHSLVPNDGFIFKSQKVEFKEGENVFEVLEREMRKAKIHMEFSFFPIYNSVYIEGINNIYEFDAGGLSGWMYKVNGWFPNYGASRYELKQGDVVEWVYTVDLGHDVGGGNVEQ